MNNRRIKIVQASEARRGTVVRVREGHWMSRFAGMRGTVRSELFWLPDLSVVNEDFAV